MTNVLITKLLVFGIPHYDEHNYYHYNHCNYYCDQYCYYDCDYDYECLEN